MTLRVALLAAECEPWAKTGGLADVVDALARALGRLPEAGRGLAAPVDVLLPRYRSVPVPEDAVAEAPLTVPDPAGGGSLTARIVNVAADGYRLRLVDVPAAFDRDTFYDHPDDAWRFAVFCRVALAALKRDGAPLDVLHVHDWHTGPALLERARGEAAGDPFFAGMAVLVTLHNLAYHGWVPNEALGQLGLRRGEPLAGDNPDGIDLLLTAIERSELANTVSPGYAAEALTPAFGMGLDGALRAKGDRFFGILNGIDPDVWDPATDAALAARYSVDAPAGKAACRADLLRRVGFDPGDDGIVLGMIGRMDPQKGFDLLAHGAPDLLAAGTRIVVQGSGHASLADPFRALVAANPRRVALIERFDREMARRIYAGSDLFLMPSRFEPCGQGQMIALRFGTPPVVRRTGGLADSVVDDDEHPGEGTGFVFDEATPAALVAAVTRAAAARADRPRWAALRDRGMRVDFRWDTGSAPRYLEAYRRAVGIRLAKPR
ncbi:MAG TPA: glycogen/starch synthase [Candidatus Limnocylindrales bacterium]